MLSLFIYFNIYNGKQTGTRNFENRVQAPTFPPGDEGISNSHPIAIFVVMFIVYISAIPNEFHSLFINYAKKITEQRNINQDERGVFLIYNSNNWKTIISILNRKKPVESKYVKTHQCTHSHIFL